MNSTYIEEVNKTGEIYFKFNDNEPQLLGEIFNNANFTITLTKDSKITFKDGENVFEIYTVDV